MTETERTLIDLAAAHFKKDAGALQPADDFFNALGIDSYRAMELLTQIEDRFDIEIPDYELQGVTTFSQLAALIEQRA